MRHSVARAMLLRGTILGLAVSTLPALPAFAADSEAAVTAVETVVVSARLRKEDQQDVPVPLQAISGDILSRDNADTLQSLAQKAPSLTISGSNPKQTSISIRGIGLSVSSDGQDASTGVFIDGVYQARPGAAAFDFEDLSQVSILRGPQGTLFGRNTSTGALVAESRSPTFTHEAQGEATTGNYGLIQVKGYVSGGLTDTLAARLTIWSTENDGFVTNTTTGNRLGSRSDQGLRAQLLYQPSETFRYRFIYTYDQQDFANVPVTITGITPSLNNAFNLYQLLDLAQPGYRPPSNPYAYTTDINAYSGSVGKKHSATAIGDWTLEDGKTLTSISNFTSWKFNPYGDSDATKFDGTQQSGGPADMIQYSQEFRVASLTEGPLNWVAGAIYFHSRVGWSFGTRTGSQAGYFSTQVNATNLARLNPANRTYGTLATAISGGLDQYATNTASSPNTDSGALFGQGTWKVDERLSFTLGLRASYDYKWEHSVQGNSVAGFDYGGLTTRGAGLTQAQWLAQYGSLFTTQANAQTVLNAIRGTPTSSVYASTSLWNGTGTAAVSYKLDDDVLAYASFSRGYKSAGLNTTIQAAGIPQVVKPEIVNDYELGLKTTFFNHRLTFNTNLFWENYKNYQANITGNNLVTGAFTQFLGNIKKIISRGVEAEISAVPIDNLQIDASASYNEVFYDSFANAPCSLEANLAGITACNLTGRTLPFAPKWIGNLRAEYDYPVDFGELYVIGNYSYRSGANIATDFTNSKYTFEGGYGLTDLRAGVRLQDGWDISAWGQNIFSTEYAAAKAVSKTTYFTSTTAGVPATYGVTLRIRL